uniref:G_PROTEIN_RECEP_F1_2 domain-containing protein n=1 Tax=Heterorhabditis bacteriophora TaxID=37862 RepID=A0A1I7WAJ4_HETBA
MNFSLIGFDFFHRFICKLPLPTYILFSHICCGRPWISHQQNRISYFHIFRFICFFSKKLILEYNKYQIHVLLLCGLLFSIMTLFFYRHQCIAEKQYKVNNKKIIFYFVLYLCIVFCLQFIFFKLCDVHPSLWPELLRKVCILLIIRYKATSTYSIIFKQNPEAMELLKIPNIYYLPPSFMLKMSVSICMLIICEQLSPLIYIILKIYFRSIRSWTHFSHPVHFSETMYTPHGRHPRTAKKVPQSSDNSGISMLFIYLPLFILDAFVFDFRLEKQLLCPDLKRINFQDEVVLIPLLKVVVPIVLLFIPYLSIFIRVLDGHLGLQILNDILVIIFSTYGTVATIFLISFNTSYREFLSGKVRAFGKSLSCLVCINQFPSHFQEHLKIRYFKKVLKKWKSCSVLHKILFFKCKKMWIKFNESKFNCLLEKGQKSRLIGYGK